MKKTVRTILLLVVLAIGLGALSACGSGNKLTGKWELTSGSHSIGYMELYKDGTGEFTPADDYTFSSTAETGYWTVTEDGTLKITGSFGGMFMHLGNINGAYALDGKTLTIEDAKKGTLVFTKVS